MKTEKVRSAFLRGAVTIALPTMAVCAPMVAQADKPDVTDGEFWYLQGVRNMLDLLRLRLHLR